MQVTQSVIDDVKDISLLTNYEAKLGLNISTSSEMLDDQIDMLIRWSSDEFALSCVRVLGRMKVQEIFRELLDCRRLPLSSWPIIEVDSVDENGVLLVEDIDFEVDSESGTLRRLGGHFWVEPTTVIYSGGYDLPNEAPDALRQATMLLAREAYYIMVRGDATIRMVSHKDARIIYFDPNSALKALAGGGGKGGGSPARRAIDDLIKSFIRFEV